MTEPGMPSAAGDAQAWSRRSTLHHSAWPAERIAAERERTVSVVLPARDEAATIGPILDALLPLREVGAIDQLLVVDHSTDGTADIARERGAEVHAQGALCPDYGRVLGKGDAMWRALSVATGDVVCFLDADTEAFGAHFATGLIGPVASRGDVQLAKARYRRPFRSTGGTAPTGGGRVTELTARPLLNALFPALAGFEQPLAGEVAIRRDLLERLPVLCGYAVDVALLIDAWRAVGLDALVQVDLDERQNRHQALERLSPMAFEVTAAILRRAHEDGRVADPPPGELLVPSDGVLEAVALPLVERPPWALARHGVM
ncbi:MAG: glucosyl-3-phosphoglycerate synthase [Solirubrobacteraceae bacterium]|nr:glucosyl-3-phosphoglycerate synthase [Solirubrobacteraceae bacterium]